MTVGAYADRLPDSLDIGGYIDGGHMPEPVAVPEPTEVAVVAEKSRDAGVRSRKRPSYSLSRPNDAPLQATDSHSANGSKPEFVEPSGESGFKAATAVEQPVNGSRPR